jgi:hypothetical protein
MGICAKGPWCFPPCLALVESRYLSQWDFSFHN